MSTYRAGFGERFRSIRRRADLTQQSLGDVLGVSRQTINTYEKERQNPSLGLVERICDTYGISPWWLMYGVGSPTADVQYPASEEVTGLELMASSEMSPLQGALIDFVKADKDRAQRLAEHLFDKGLYRPEEETSE